MTETDLRTERELLKAQDEFNPHAATISGPATGEKREDGRPRSVAVSRASHPRRREKLRVVFRLAFVIGLVAVLAVALGGPSALPPSTDLESEPAASAAASDEAAPLSASSDQEEAAISGVAAGLMADPVGYSTSTTPGVAAGLMADPAESGDPVEPSPTDECAFTSGVR